MLEGVAVDWALLLAVALAIGGPPPVAKMVAPPVCPPAGAFPTPVSGVPRAPSDVDLVGGVLSWSDNADNEDGYLICARPGDFEHTVGANTTAFVPPPDWPPRCPDVEYADFNVHAFNDNGLSSPDGWSVMVECTVTPTEPSPRAAATPAVLPPSGEGAGDGASESVVVWPLLGVLLVAAGGLGVFGVWRVRMQRR
jgi:hypothetical protein